MHLIAFREIVRDAEVANAISAVVRRHRLTKEETEKGPLELRIPRAANAPESFFIKPTNGQRKEPARWHVRE